MHPFQRDLGVCHNPAGGEGEDDEKEAEEEVEEEGNEG